MKNSKDYSAAKQFNKPEKMDQHWLKHCGTKKAREVFFGRYRCRFEPVSELIVGRTVLDVGCGVSMIPQFIDTIETKYHGIDFSESASILMRGLFPNINMYVADLKDELPFHDNVFDTVLAQEFLEHLEDYMPIVEEIKRVAKKRVVITVPASLEHPSHFHPTWTEDTCLNLFEDPKNTTVEGVGNRWRLIVWNKMV